jgi:RNA polymerase sigma-70 factor (ECF subfamily)
VFFLFFSGFCMDDTKILLQAIRRMDAQALTKVFDLYATAIYKYAYRHCGDAITADQIVGDVFSKLLDQLSQGHGPTSNLRSYLFEMAHHALVDDIRRSRKMTPVSAIESFIPVAGATDIKVEDQTLLEIMVRAIQCKLTDDQRHVIILRFFEDFSLKETALIMGKTVTNIKVIQNRAVAALRKAIDNQAVEYQSVQL